MWEVYGSELPVSSFAQGFANPPPEVNEMKHLHALLAMKAAGGEGGRLPVPCREADKCERLPFPSSFPFSLAWEWVQLRWQPQPGQRRVLEDTLLRELDKAMQSGPRLSPHVLTEEALANDEVRLALGRVAPVSPLTPSFGSR